MRLMPLQLPALMLRREQTGTLISDLASFAFYFASYSDLDDSIAYTNILQQVTVITVAQWTLPGLRCVSTNS